jgi:cell division protein FtsQ
LWNLRGYIKPGVFPIEHVKIFATYEHVEQKILQKIVDEYLNGGFFYLNVTELKQQLLKMPWIYAVSIQRRWPDTVIINIAEQQAVLQWGAEALVNPNGTIFSPSKTTFPKGLPIIFGPEEKESEIFTLYHKMLATLEPLDVTIKRLVLHPQQHHWEMLLSNDTVVYLKKDDPLSQLELLVSAYRKITANREQAPKSIDLRYHSGLAVKWG